MLDICYLGSLRASSPKVKEVVKFLLLGIALDKWMSEYFLPEIKKANPKAKIQKSSKPLDSGMGFITHDEDIFKMKTFFHRQNVDNMQKLWFDIALGFNLVNIFWS